MPETFLARFPVPVKSKVTRAKRTERYYFDGADTVVGTVKSIGSDFGHDG